MNPSTPGCRSDFTWTRVAPHVVAVIDSDIGGMSVTNDAENVVAFLLSNGHAKDDDVVIYRDSMGWWDQLAHSGRKFLGFKVLRAGDINEALRKIGHPRS